MSFRDGIGRDIAAKRQRDRRAEDDRRFQRIADLVGIVRLGNMTTRSFNEVALQILSGDAGRVVRIGEEIRPDHHNGEQR